MALTTAEIEAAARAAKDAEKTPANPEDKGDEFTPDPEETTPPPVKKTAPKKAAAPKKEKEPEPKEEVEEEEEPEEEEEEPETPDPEPEPRRAEGMVPRGALRAEREKYRAREAQANERAAQLEARIAELEGRNRNDKAWQEWTQKLDGLYEAVETARAEGKSADAAKLQRQLDGMRDQASRAESEYMAAQAALRAQQTAEYNAVVDQAELLDPRLDPQADEYDEDLMDEVSDLTQAFEARGLDAATALKRSLKAVLGKDIFKKAPAAETAKATSKKTDVGKNINAAKKTPPETTERPERPNDISDVGKLSDDEWEKLPEATRQRLRGDFAT
jgi:hypothetical protein